MVLVVLAAIMIPLATTAVWATRTVLNEEKFSDTVDGVISDPGVITVVSTRLTDEIFQALLGSQLVQSLPPQLKTAVAFVSGALQSRVQERVDGVLSSEQGQDLLDAAVRRAHRAAMRLLEGNGLLSNSAFTIEDGTVTLDLVSVVRQVLVGLQEDGVVPASIKIPAEGEPPGALGTAIGAKLPPDFGQLVVYRTDAADLDGTLETAQRALVVLKRGVVLAVILAVVLGVAAVLVAVDRRLGLYHLALGVTIVALLLVVVARRVTAAVPNAAKTPGGQTVAAALADALRSSLVRALFILAIVAAVTAIVSRTWNGLLVLIAAHEDIARIIAVGLGLLVLIVLGLGWGSLIFAVVVAGLGLLTVQLAGSRTNVEPRPA
jgi:hypothetical protein